MPCEALALKCHQRWRERAGVVPVPLPCHQHLAPYFPPSITAGSSAGAGSPVLQGTLWAGWGRRGLVAPFCAEGPVPGWHGVARWPRGAQHHPAPLPDVQMFRGTPLAAVFGK